MASEPEPPRECEPTYTLDKQIAEARRQIGERRWAKLNDEWNEQPTGGKLPSPERYSI